MSIENNNTSLGGINNMNRTPGGPRRSDNNPPTRERSTSRARPARRTSTGTVGENIIATIKMQNNFWYPLRMVFFPILQ